MVINNFIYLTDPVNTNAYADGVSYKLNTIDEIVELKEDFEALNSKTYVYIGVRLTEDQYGVSGEPDVLLKETQEDEAERVTVASLSTVLKDKIDIIKGLIEIEVNKQIL